MLSLWHVSRVLEGGINMRNRRSLYVGLYEDVDLFSLEGASQCVQALVGTTLAVAVATLLDAARRGVRAPAWWRVPRFCPRSC